VPPPVVVVEEVVVLPATGLAAGVAFVVVVVVVLEPGLAAAEVAGLGAALCPNDTAGISVSAAVSTAHAPAFPMRLFM
jgi:hypothetical protein